jgi:hypothetical protein
VRVAAEHVPVVRVDRGGMHADQRVVGPHVGRVGVHELQDVRGAEPSLNDRLHQCSFVLVRAVTSEGMKPLTQG